MDQKPFLTVVDGLYDAALDPSGWAAMAGKLAHFLDSESGWLISTNPQGGGTDAFSATDNLNGKFVADYESYYYQFDRWAVGGLASPGRAILGDEVAPAEWYRSSEFFNEACRAADVHMLVGVMLPLQADHLVIASAHRPKHAPRFGQTDRQNLDRLVPHITRSFQLARRLAAARLEQAASLEALECLGTATIAVNRQGRILFANRRADTLLQEGSALSVANGRLISTNRQVAGRLGLLIQTAVDTAAGRPARAPSGVLAIERGPDRLPLTILVAPFRPRRDGFGAPFPAALLFVSDPERLGAPADLLQDLFGLTPAQAAVATRLAAGDSVEQIARALRISLHTARDHLKVIFAKTGTVRQAQLVVLLLRSVAGMVVPP